MIARAVEIARGLWAVVEAEPGLAHAAPVGADTAGAPVVARVRASHDDAATGLAPPEDADAPNPLDLAWTTDLAAHLRVVGGEGSVTRRAGAPLDVALGTSPDRAAAAIATALHLALHLALAGDAAGALVLHASACAGPRGAWLFFGASGAGKTTTARRLGREGAARIADDLVVARLAGGVARVEACRFDRAARLEGRLDAAWELAAAHVVKKGAAASRRAPCPSALAAWSEAAVPLPLPRDLAARRLDTVVALARLVPTFDLDAAPRGRLIDAVDPG